MENKALKILEFDKILNIMAEFTSNEAVKKRIISLKPSKDLAEAKKYQHQTTEAANMIIQHGEIPSLSVSDITVSTKRVSLGASLSMRALLDISRLLSASRRIKDYIGKGESVPILQGLAERITVLKPLEQQIEMCILSEEEIADTASPTLSSIRRKMRSLQGKIKDTLDSIIHSTHYQKYLQEPIVTMRDGRYVIPVKAQYKSEVAGIVHDSSSSGVTIFVEPMSVVNTNNEIHSLKADEAAEIERILASLSAKVSEFGYEIDENYEAVCEADFIFCKGRLSVSLGATEPILNSDGIIDIKKARHPLIAKQSVVANDIMLGGDFDTLVITGPNTGGKTVTLKTIGLFSIMAASGLHIPANDNSRAAVFDSVWADIGDEQSIEQNLSTFSSHMTNIVKITKNAGKNSLVLFDELGAGTDPVEGAALAVSILEYLRLEGATIAATTHYSELKLFALSTPGVLNASCEFDVQTLRPTYKLLIGVPGRSNAFAISKRLGLNDMIIQRAKSKMSEDSIHFEDIIRNLQKSRKKADSEAQKAKQMRREADEIKEKISEQKQTLDEKKQKILDEARREAKRIILEAKEESNAVIKELNSLKKAAKAQNISKGAEQLRMRLREKEKNIDESFSGVIKPQVQKNAPKTVKPGDKVEVLSLGQICEVLKAPDTSGNVLVLAGIMKINASLSDLRVVTSMPKEVKKAPSHIGYTSKKSGIKTETDLRGMNLEEAIMEADRFIDDAYMAGLNQISIIHGKGTGILRSGISDMLRRHKLVKSFRLGKYGEGEDGVTIVELK